MLFVCYCPQDFEGSDSHGKGVVKDLPAGSTCIFHGAVLPEKDNLAPPQCYNLSLVEWTRAECDIRG